MRAAELVAVAECAVDHDRDIWYINGADGNLCAKIRTRAGAEDALRVMVRDHNPSYASTLSQLRMHDAIFSRSPAANCSAS